MILVIVHRKKQKPTQTERCDSEELAVALRTNGLFLQHRLEICP